MIFAQKQKNKKHTKHSERDHSTGTMGSVKGLAQNLSTISSNELLECSVTLEKLNMDELNKSNTNRESNEKHGSPVESTDLMSQLNMSHSENMAINMDMDMDMDTIEIMASHDNETITIPEHNYMEYPHVVNIAPAHQLNHEQNQFYFEIERFNETLTPLPLNFETNACDAYSVSQNQLPSIVEVHSNFQVKQEKMDALPIFKSDNVIYEVFDSDEEEALNSRDSGRETNDTIIDLDSSHIPTMGVLMMSKK